MEALIQMLKAVPKAEDYVVDRKINTYGEAMLYKFMALQYTRGQWELAQKVIQILKSDQVHQEVSLDGTRAVILGENLYKQHDEGPQKLEFTSEQPESFAEEMSLLSIAKREAQIAAEQPESGERDPESCPVCGEWLTVYTNIPYKMCENGNCKVNGLLRPAEQPPATPALEAIRSLDEALGNKPNDYGHFRREVRLILEQALTATTEPVRCDVAADTCEPEEPREWGEYQDGVFVEVVQIDCATHIPDGVISKTVTPREPATSDSEGE